jgi:hypothetical protein
VRVFVTGIYGSGKTTTARRISQDRGLEFVSFDHGWDYSTDSPAQALAFLAALPTDCVVDAIPFDPTYATFHEWAEGKDVEVHVATCPFDEWRKRVLARADQFASFRPEHADREHFASYHLESLPAIEIPLHWAPSHPQAMETLGYAEMIRDRIESAPDGYDATYQDVPEIGFEGYSDSAGTWEQIRDLVEWKGKSVVDLGCFHGFHSFRAHASGARSVVGMDQATQALITARAINVMGGHRVKFQHWTADDPVPPADVTLCLNALHHFPNQAATLAAIQSPLTILQAKPETEATIRAAFPRVDVFQTMSRPIYRCHR